jgi:hypothetical protein
MRLLWKIHAWCGLLLISEYITELCGYFAGCMHGAVFCSLVSTLLNYAATLQDYGVTRSNSS